MEIDDLNFDVDYPFDPAHQPARGVMTPNEVFNLGLVVAKHEGLDDDDAIELFEHAEGLVGMIEDLCDVVQTQSGRLREQAERVSNIETFNKELQEDVKRLQRIVTQDMQSEAAQ